MEIAENVHRVDDTSGSNCILLLDKNIAVVDTGNPGNAQTIVAVSYTHLTLPTTPYV